MLTDSVSSSGLRSVACTHPLLSEPCVTPQNHSLRTAFPGILGLLEYSYVLTCFPFLVRVVSSLLSTTFFWRLSEPNQLNNHIPAPDRESN
jgi:hypothetical protein